MDYNPNITINLSNDKNAPWIILINGLFADLNAWGPLVKYLTEYFNILRYDGQGQGENYLRHLQSLEEQVVQLNRIIETRKISDVILLGISNGGRIALSYAANFPAQVRHVFAANTYSELDRELSQILESWLLASKEGGGKKRFNASYSYIFGKSFLDQNEDNIDLFEKAACEKDQLSMEFLIESNLDIEPIPLHLIECPVTLIAGSEDILTPIPYQIKMLKEIKNCEMIQVRAGHASFYENPKLALDIILPYITHKEQVNELDKFSR